MQNEASIWGIIAGCHSKLKGFTNNYYKIKHNKILLLIRNPNHKESNNSDY